jgi:lysyl-tRNA synthetase class 1
MHWADVIAKEIADTCEKPLIATGISPSGTIHVGSLREAVTGESVRSAVESFGKDVHMIYLIDSFDQLKKRSDFLPTWYDDHIGKPISQIPCPCGKHDNFAHHFVQPFLDAVGSLEVKCEVVWTHELYEKGLFAKAIDLCFKKREEIIKILHEVSGREAKGTYAPYNPVCKQCGRFTNPIFESYSYPTVEYQCSCGYHGVADITKGDGKLTWRLEWPAKWLIFGTSAEPFGKDHAAAGGSYDTGKRIAEEIYGIKAPYPIPYEFVQLKGVGQMHKSTGSSVTGMDAINMTPPEVVNYLFLRVNPSKAIDYDPGKGVLDMADEYDRMERLFFSGQFTEAEENSVEAYRIAQHNRIPEKLPLQIPYRHLVNVVQMASSFEGVLEILGRTIDLSEAKDDDIKRLRKRAECVRFWLNGFAPDDVKFLVYPTIPPGTEITMGDKAFFQKLVERMNEASWDADTISQIIAETGKESTIGLKAGFVVIYKVLIGKEAGPRLGSFLASMDKQFVINRFIQASRYNS